MMPCAFSLRSSSVYSPMTCPLIGNYGVDPEQDESRQPWISGLIVRELCDEPSHYRMKGTFADYLRRHRIPGIKGIDTRALTRHLRDRGAMRVGIFSGDEARRSDEALLRTVHDAPRMAGSALAGHQGVPVLLTRQGALPNSTATELERLNPERIVVLGGPVAVSNDVIEDISDVWED